jgi:hypothetical protein
VEAPPGFEPGMEVLQTSALPLGDGADRMGCCQTVEHRIVPDAQPAIKDAARHGRGRERVTPVDRRPDPSRRLSAAGGLWYDRGSLVSGNNSVVECDLAKVEVAGSNPVSRSISYLRSRATPSISLARWVPAVGFGHSTSPAGLRPQPLTLSSNGMPLGPP